jgi:hypothetical protein
MDNKNTDTIKEPPNAFLYKQIITGIVKNSKSTDAVMRQLGPELTPEMSQRDVLDTALNASIGLDRHPSDTLQPSEKTFDVIALMNAYSSLEASRTILHPLDREAFDKYLTNYGEYRLALLDNVLAKSRNDMGRASQCAQKQADLERLLITLRSQGEDREKLNRAQQDIVDEFTNLIKGQIETRLQSIGKNDDPGLHDPTFVRLTEDDIRYASYQYALIVDALVRKTAT